MPRIRSRIAGAAVFLAALPLAVSPPAVAAATPDYTITVDPGAGGPTIDDSMYGVFFEDINFAADGGLYAELVRNRSFEFLPADNRSRGGSASARGGRGGQSRGGQSRGGQNRGPQGGRPQGSRNRNRRSGSRPPARSN